MPLCNSSYMFLVWAHSIQAWYKNSKLFQIILCVVEPVQQTAHTAHTTHRDTGTNLERETTDFLRKRQSLRKISTTTKNHACAHATKKKTPNKITEHLCLSRRYITGYAGSIKLKADICILQHFLLSYHTKPTCSVLCHALSGRQRKHRKTCLHVLPLAAESRHNHIEPYPTVPYPTLLYPTPRYSTLPYSTLPYPILPYRALSNYTIPH